MLIDVSADVVITVLVDVVTDDLTVPELNNDLAGSVIVNNLEFSNVIWARKSKCR